MALVSPSGSFSLDKPNGRRRDRFRLLRWHGATVAHDVSSPHGASIMRRVCRDNTSLSERWAPSSLYGPALAVPDCKVDQGPSTQQALWINGEECTGMPDVKQSVWLRSVGRSEARPMIPDIPRGKFVESVRLPDTARGQRSHGSLLINCP